MFELPLIGYILLFIIPAYIANSAPVILGGVYPIDGGANFFDGRRIFGEGKTWYGLLGGVFLGVLSSILLAFILSGGPYDLFGAQPQYYILCGIALSAGALFGDLAGSFIKRRLGAKRGDSVLLDQITFLLGALAFCYPLGLTIIFQPINALFLFVITYFIHRFANFAAHHAGLKRVPW
ncbi:MAG: CDP-2,3-bis-(O-geranylgeranyl)-sn-glycerol synthase [Candidatus Micrarchaeota archaeon]